MKIRVDFPSLNLEVHASWNSLRRSVGFFKMRELRSKHQEALAVVSRLGNTVHVVFTEPPTINTITHEAFHVCMRFMEAVGDGEHASEEFRAYALGSIVDDIIGELPINYKVALYKDH